MVENILRVIYLLSTLILSCAFVLAFYQHPLAMSLSAKSGVSLHLMTVIPAIFVHFFTSLGVIFYFVGSGVWIKDHAFKIMPTNKESAQKLFEIYKKANKLKGLAFPFATFNIFLGILTFVIGGAVHVGAIPHWVHPSLGAALIACSWIGIPFIFSAILKNFEFLNTASLEIDSHKP